MKVLLINRFWADTHIPTGRMLFDVAKALSDAGHSIVVLTSVDTYVNVPGEKKDFHSNQVVRIKTFGPRFLRWILFWAITMVAPLLMRWDTCVVLTDPPFMNFFAIWDRWFRGGKRRRFWWVMDLFPEFIIASNVARKGGIVDSVARFFTNLSLKSLNGVIVLDEVQKKRLSAYPYWKENTEFSLLVPPWDFRELNRPLDGRNRFLDMTDFGDKKVILYAGNLGRAHVFEPLVEAANELCARGQKDWIFVFACRGYKRKALEKAALAIPNVRVMDYVPPEITSDMLFAASAHVITMGKDWEGIVVPSKLYGLIPTRKPVLFIGPLDSGTALEILRHRLGTVLPLDAGPIKIIETLEALMASPLEGRYKEDRTGPMKIMDFITRG